jgi:hypothetical protein
MGFENPMIASVLFEEDQLKLIYKEHGDNPIVNFFLGYN